MNPSPNTVAYASKPTGFCHACGAGLSPADDGQCGRCGRRFSIAEPATFARWRPSRTVIGLRQCGISVAYLQFIIGFAVMLAARGRLVGPLFLFSGAALVCGGLLIVCASRLLRWRLSDRDGSRAYVPPSRRTRRWAAGMAAFFALSAVVNVPERVVAWLNTFAFNHAYFVEPMMTAGSREPGYFGVMWTRRVRVEPNRIYVDFDDRYEQLIWTPDGRTRHQDMAGLWRYSQFLQ